MANHAPDTARITELLLAVSDGGRDALDQLVPAVYDHLRRIAGAQRPAIRCSQPPSYTKPTSD